MYSLFKIPHIFKERLSLSVKTDLSTFFLFILLKILYCPTPSFYLSHFPSLIPFHHLLPTPTEPLRSPHHSGLYILL